MDSFNQENVKKANIFLEMVCTALAEIFGAVDGSFYLCYSCYYCISISRQTLVLFFF